MRPFDDMPLDERDYSDVALLVASVREWPREDFARDLDARVARRFEPPVPPTGGRVVRARLPRWAAGPAVALVAGVVAAVVVLSGASEPAPKASSSNGLAGFSGLRQTEKPVVHGGSSRGSATTSFAPQAGAGSAGTATYAPSANQGLALTTNTATSAAPPSAGAPVAPGSKQIRSAQLSLTTPNQHVDQVATEVYGVVGTEHGSVLSSHITTATSDSGGGYATFSLSIPTNNLQDAMRQLSGLRYATLRSSSDGSQNVSHQYNSDQRQLADAKALRTSLLKQLQTAYTQTAIDSIKAQLKLAEQQIDTWQSTLDSLQHRISYSNLSVQINAGGLPVAPIAKHSSSFTIGRAGHDALRVLVVSAGVALIALAVALPIGLVAALLVWLWVWLRQRRREHALDATA